MAKKLSKKVQEIINDVEKIQDEVGKELTSTEEVEQTIDAIVSSELDNELEKIASEQSAPAKKAVKQVKPKAEKPAAEKKEKVTSPNARIVTFDGNKQTAQGHKLMTAEIALDILARQAAVEEKGEKLDRKALSAEVNIGVGTIADVLSGQPVIVKMLEKAGFTHPHPRNENGPRVGVTRKHVAEASELVTRVEHTTDAEEVTTAEEKPAEKPVKRSHKKSSKPATEAAVE